jgi:hypothetical protein
MDTPGDRVSKSVARSILMSGWILWLLPGDPENFCRGNESVNLFSVTAQRQGCASSERQESK